MAFQSRRPPTPARAKPVKAALFVRSRRATQEDFWNALADDTEAMSNEELRAELARFRLRGPRDFH